MTTGTGLELILNAAEGALQMVVTEDETLLCAQEWRRPERATEILAPALRHICAALDLRLGGFSPPGLRARARLFYRHPPGAGHGRGPAPHGAGAAGGPGLPAGPGRHPGCG